MYYPYANTPSFECLSVFKEIPREQGKPGDLVLYRGHIGILSKNGSVISATVGGVRHRSKLNSDDPEFLPSITELPIGLAGSGKPKVMQWSCP
jgi:cell wall-associated NlpC family hydrolase